MSTTTCTICGASYDSGMDETVAACPACPDLLVVTLDGGDASDADAALAVDLDAGGGRWSALVRRDRIAETLTKTGAAQHGEPVAWDGERYGDGSGVVWRETDGSIAGNGCYSVAYLAAKAA